MSTDHTAALLIVVLCLVILAGMLFQVTDFDQVIYVYEGKIVCEQALEQWVCKRL